MNRHSFSLSSIGMTKGRAQVKLDGEDISDAVGGIGLDFSAREHPRVMLELTGVSADVAVDDVEIQLPQKIVELLQRLGWISPTAAVDLRNALRAAAQDVVASIDGPYGPDVLEELRNGHPATVSGPALADLIEALGEQPVPTSDEPASEGPSGAVGESIT